MMRIVESCRNCGHSKGEHNGSSGPNSIGRWSFGECTNGCRVISPYRFGGCQCSAYKRKRRIAFKPASEVEQ